MKFLRPSRHRTGNAILNAQPRMLLFFLLLTSSTAHAVGGATIENGKTNYFTIEPAFVVNVVDGRQLRFLQVAVDIVSMDSNTIEAVQDHRAPIRHELLMLFAHRELAEVMGLRQREELRQAALQRIQEALLKYADIKPDATAKDKDGNKYPTGIQDVLFTSFVIQ